MDEHRAIELRRNRGLVRRAEVSAPLERQALLLSSFAASSYWSRGNGALTFCERRDIALEDLQLRHAPLENPRDHVDDERLGEIHDVVERRVGHLRLDHPEFGQMAPRLRLFSAERRAKAYTRPSAMAFASLYSWPL